MASTTISGSGTRNNKGTVFGGGNIAGSSFRALTQVTNAIDAVSKFRGITPSFKSGVESVLKGTAVTLVSQITESSGYCLITKTSHGLSLGDLIVVYGQVPTTYNTVHRVISVVDANSVKTDVFYVADSTTAGYYKPFSGDFSKMTARRYIGTTIGTHVAGSASSLMRITSSDYFRVPFNRAAGYRRNHVTSWSYTTGAATKGANAGDLIKLHDIANNVDTLTSEPFPTRSVPGELVYFNGLKGGPAMSDYSQKNG